MSHREIQLNDTVKFTGYPSYKRGLIGEVFYVSEFTPDSFQVRFPDGSWICTDSFNVEVVDGGK